ncbi:unnamed protein product [Mytilus coruscus]|uniref:Uncharacterized protein n=1 Tax=Mytilus coruscus TaxID=42192 RepID=A0A6J8CGI0_MYTCO|nr:unnamed protein product [Mytilus coruscus]
MFLYVLILDLIPHGFQYGKSDIVITKMPGSMFVLGHTIMQAEVTASSVVVVNGRPIISKKDVTLDGQTWLLSVYFSKSSLPIEVKWYINDTHIQQNNSSTIKIANLTLICYEKIISTEGYRSYFLLTISNGRENNPPLEIQNESQYEEIDDRSYNSVKWRNYDLNATSSLDASTDDSDRNSQSEMYNSIFNVYVELENSQPETDHYQPTTEYEIPADITSANSLVKFKVIK